MLLLKFNYDDIEKCKSAEDVYRMFGIGVAEKDDGYTVHMTDEKVFGKRAYYRNMVMSQEAYDAVLDVMKKIPNYKGMKNPKDRLSYAAIEWVNYSPMSSGPRYEQVKELAGGEINRSVLYILTPDDELYEEAPTSGDR